MFVTLLSTVLSEGVCLTVSHIVTSCSWSEASTPSHITPGPDHQTAANKLKVVQRGGESSLYWYYGVRLVELLSQLLLEIIDVVN